MMKGGLEMSVVWNEEAKAWDATFPDFTTRRFDGRFTEQEAHSKARRWFFGQDSWMDGLYQAG